MDKSVFWFSSALFFHGSKYAGIIQDISLRGINWELTGKNALFDQSSPVYSDHATAFTINSLMWSTKTVERWTDAPASPT
jgi:hypothetical protein